VSLGLGDEPGQGQEFPSLFLTESCEMRPVCLDRAQHPQACA